MAAVTQQSSFLLSEGNPGLSLKGIKKLIVVRMWLLELLKAEKKKQQQQKTGQALLTAEEKSAMGFSNQISIYFHCKTFRKRN